MTKPTPEQEAIRSYDRQRRLASNQIIVAAFIIILAAIIVAFSSYSIIQPTIYTILLDGVFAFCFCLYGVSFLATRRRNLALASLTMIAATDITVIVAALIWITLLAKPLGGTQLNPVTFAQFTSFGVPIILAGVLGERWLVIATAVLMNLTSLFIIHIVPIAALQGLFTVLVIGQQWAFAAITLTISRLYQRTLGDLGKAYIQAQQVDELKDQFITNVNHELRTPIMTIQGYIELLRLTHKRLSSEQLATSLEKASQTGYSLLALLNSILDVQHIDQQLPGFIPETVLLQNAIDQALLLVDPHEGHLSDHPVHVQISKHIEILGEPMRIQQILINLLSNASKYSASGMPVEVSAHTVSEPVAKTGFMGRHLVRRALIEIIVHDHGHGIPPDQIPLLFNRFVRLPRDLASSVSGNGLGLYLCRVYAESMGGRIWVESAGIEGEGATFHLLLPAAASSAEDLDMTLPRLRVLPTQR